LKVFHFRRWESVRVFINGIGKLDFLHLSKLVPANFFKHLSISSNVLLRQVCCCYPVYGDRFLQLLRELNLQLDCSVAAIQKAVFSHFNSVRFCMSFYYYFYCHYHLLSLVVLFVLILHTSLVNKHVHRWPTYFIVSRHECCMLTAKCKRLC